MHAWSTAHSCSEYLTHHIERVQLGCQRHWRNCWPRSLCRGPPRRLANLGCRPLSAVARAEEAACHVQGWCTTSASPHPLLVLLALLVVLQMLPRRVGLVPVVVAAAAMQMRYDAPREATCCPWELAVRCHHQLGAAFPRNLSNSVPDALRHAVRPVALDPLLPPPMLMA